MTDKYLEGKIQAALITLAGSMMGANAAGLRGHHMHYDDGEYARSVLRKTIEQVARYYYKKGVNKYP